MWRGHRSQVPAWTEAANGLEGAASDLKRDLLAYSHLARRRPRNPHREIPSPWRMEIEVVWPMNKIWFPVCHCAEEHYDRKVLEEAYNWQDRVRSLTGYQDVDWIAAPPMAFVLKNFFYLLRACSPACSFELDQAGSSINAAKMVKTQCLALLSFCPVYWHALL